MAASHDGKLVASGDSAKYIRIWMADTREIYTDEFIYHSSKIYSLCWSKDDRLLVSTALDNGAYLWNVQDKHLVRRFLVVDIDIATCCVFYDDTNSFVIGGHNCSPKRIYYIA